MRDIPTRDMSVGESKWVLRGLCSFLELHEFSAEFSVPLDTASWRVHTWYQAEYGTTFVFIHNTTHLAAPEHRQSKAASAYQVLWAYSSHCFPALKQMKCTYIEKRRWEDCGHGTGLNLHFSVKPWYFLIFLLTPLLTSWNKDSGFYIVQGWLSIWSWQVWFWGTIKVPSQREREQTRKVEMFNNVLQ